MAIELQVVQFWSEIIIVISNRMISDQIALHSVQLPLFIDTEIVEKPIFVNLTRVFSEPIQLQCMLVKLE